MRSRLAATTRTKRSLVAASLVLLVASTGIAVHYTREVLRARSVTRQRIRAALASPRITLHATDLSEAELGALLAVQDPRFFDHAGWDFAHGTMTTITQALVKWHYFEDFRPGIAKIRQSLIARFALDPLVSKDDQLTLFINEIWLATVDGRDVNGFAEGARAFYGKRFQGLTFDEYLSLLVFDSPATLNVHVNRRGNVRRVRQIRRLLAGECRRPGLLHLPPHCFSEEPS